MEEVYPVWYNIWVHLIIYFIVVLCHAQEYFVHMTATSIMVVGKLAVPGRNPWVCCWRIYEFIHILHDFSQIFEWSFQ